jgi:hypothetical protein
MKVDSRHNMMTGTRDNRSTISNYLLNRIMEGNQLKITTRDQKILKPGTLTTLDTSSIRVYSSTSSLLLKNESNQLTRALVAVSTAGQTVKVQGGRIFSHLKLAWVVASALTHRI